MGFPGGACGQEPICQWRRHKRHRFPGVRKIPWRRAWQPTPVFLPGGSQGQRSLVGYSPWGCKEPDMTEWITLSKCIAIYLLGHMCHGFSRTFTQSRTETGEKRTGQKLEKNDIAQGHDTGWLEANRSKMSSLTGGLEPQYTITVTCAHTHKLRDTPAGALTALRPTIKDEKAGWLLAQILEILPFLLK